MNQFIPFKNLILCKLFYFPSPYFALKISFLAAPWCRFSGKARFVLFTKGGESRALALREAKPKVSRFLAEREPRFARFARPLVSRFARSGRKETFGVVFRFARDLCDLLLLTFVTREREQESVI